MTGSTQLPALFNLKQFYLFKIIEQAISFLQVAILLALFAAANATALVGIAHTGNSITSRHQDVSLQRFYVQIS